MFCFGIGLRGFSDRSTTNLFPFLPLCCGSQAVSWFIHQEDEGSWQKFDRCLAAGTSPPCIRSLRSWVPGGEILPFSQPKTAPGVIAVFQDSYKVYHSCEISVVPWTNGNFAGVRSGWQILSIPECCWDRGCLSPPCPQPLCQSALPFSGDPGAQDTKGRPVSTWQIENFCKPRSFKCKWNLVWASGSFQQE